MVRKPADPSTDFLGERAWKAVARQQAIESATYILDRSTLGPVASHVVRQLVDGILGVIGPAYEAAIRDAVLRFIAVRCDDDDVLAPPLTLLHGDGPHVDAVVAFLWRKYPQDRYEEERRDAGH